MAKDALTNGFWYLQIKNGSTDLKNGNNFQTQGEVEEFLATAGNNESRQFMAANIIDFAEEDAD